MGVELKLAGALLVAGFCGLLGVAAGTALKQRKLLLQEFCRGLILLEQEMKGMKEPLGDAALQISRVLSEPTASFFRLTGKKLQELPGVPFLCVWEEAMEQHLNHTSLKEEDLDLIRQLGNQLNYMEPDRESAAITVLLQRMETLRKEAGEAYQAKAGLYRRLGIIGGIFLIIILI